MQIEIGTVKGFQDYTPPESIKREEIKKLIEKYFQLYGFIPVETPVIEFDELMKSDALGNEDEAISDRFRLKDKGGRNLALRYEFTFQLARIFKQNPNIKLPFKRYQIGPVFRDEPTSSSRFRQFTQCDADIIGDASADADAECLALISDILKELKVNAEIEINNKKLLNAIIESVEIKEVREVMKELDKIDKIGFDMVKANLRKYTSVNQIITLFKLMEKDIAFLKENEFEGINELEELIKKAKPYGIKMKYNPFLIRGLSYYTGNIFEIREPGKPSIAAGGRYNKSVGKFLNREIPAVGISFGLERLAESAKIEIKPIPKVLIISIEQDSEAVKLSKKIRKENISCSTAFGKPSQALDYANSLQILYVVFIGAEEKAKKKFKLKDMKTGEEILLSEKQLINKLKK